MLGFRVGEFTWSALPDVRHEGCLKKIWLPYAPLVNLLCVAAWYRAKFGAVAREWSHLAKDSTVVVWH